YKILSHRTVYTAFDTAQTLKIDPKIVAKTLIVQADRQLVIVAIPGDRNLDIPKLKKVISQWSKQQGQAAIKKVSLVTERTITNKLTKTTSAVVPVGGLYKLPTIIDTALLSLKKVVLNAGSFELSLEMSGAGLKKLAEPIVGAFSKKRT
ncbi:MAG: YbaK/EbsC family protein, partial [bacterium]|nr:YbaK/EbsC family protein [bacterium]